MSEPVETIQFQKAKDFWQERTRRASSACNTNAPVLPPAFARSCSTLVTNSMPEPATPAPPSNPNASLSITTEPLAAITPMTPAPDATMPPTPPASGPSNPNTTFGEMLKTKLFASDGNPNGSKDATPQVSLPSLAVQLPDMTAWKERMRNYSSANKVKTASIASAISSSWKSVSAQVSSSSSSINSNNSSTASSPTTAVVENLHCPYKGDGDTKTTSPYGELLVVEVLAARDLAVGDFFQGESDPYVTIQFQSFERSTQVIKSTLHPVYNERFVFYVDAQEATTVNQQHVQVQIMNRNLVMADEPLGFVTLSLAMPVNEPFDAWYPLVKKEDGLEHGRIRIGLRRMAIGSSSIQAAAMALASHARSLNDDDLEAHGSIIPELWYGFAEAEEPYEAARAPLDPSSTTAMLKEQADVLASKLNVLGRRFMGIELTSSSTDQRDTF